MNTIANPHLLQESRIYYKYRFVFVYLFIALTFVQNSISQTLAFPEANGFGRYATGGRGGSVIKVTNLNNSGAGSLREAVTTNGSKTIIFEVGGTITLTSNLTVSANTTIAGQTAPGGGILIKGGKVQIVESNVIIRHIRMRPDGVGGDAISVTAYNGTTVENVIIDHCSMSWASDENVNFRTTGGGTSTAVLRNITLQNCLVGESPYAVLNGGGRSYNITIYNNLFALNQDRHIRSQGSGEIGNTYFAFEMINNIVYGFDSNSNFSYGHKMSAINNHWVPSTEVTDDSNYLYKTLPEFGGVLADTDAYITGNTVPQGHGEYETELNPYITGTPFASTGIVPVAAVDIETNLLSHVGASKPNRDAVDTRLIAHYNARDGSLSETRTFPAIAGGTAPTDTDDDGMPDYWENENGLDINNPADRNIVQPDGYTNLEYYLNGMTLNLTGLNAGINQEICEGSEAILTATGATSYTWNTGEITASITVTPNITTTYTVTGTDANGDTSTDSIVVTVNAIPVANAGADATICEDEEVTLTASGGSTYLWSNGATTQSITVSPASSTSYSVIATQNSCSSTDEVVVTVKPRQTINAGNDVDINLGESTTLTVIGAGTIVWNTGETTASITVSPTTNTTYTVAVTEQNGCTSTDEVSVTIIASVNVNAGVDASICEGSEAILTATGAISYAWNTGETTASITVTPNITTTYTVTGTDANGDTSTDSIVVTVNAIPVANAGADATICEDEEVTLTASGGSTYLWSNGATTQSITVSPASSTSYSVIAIQNSCSSTDEVAVTVNPRQTINAGNDVDINLGESATLTVIGAGSIVWNTGETTASITVSPTTNTIYIVAVTEQNGCTSTDEVRVTIIGSVNANAGVDASICEGEDTILTASGGDDYLWSTGETTASITVNPLSTTNYTVIVSNAITSDTDEVTVYVNAVPNVEAGDDKTIDLGEYVTLSATGADTYLWSNGATQPNIAVSPQNTTTYYVTGYTNNCSNEAQVTVNVANAVSANAGKDMNICNGDTLTLVASGGVSYLWSTGETSKSIDVTPSEDTIYTVTVSNEYASDSDDVSVIVEDCGGEEENSNYQYSVYPNPASAGVLHIQLSGLTNVSNLYIHDTIGKLIYIEAINDNNGQIIQKSINISDYSSGLYFVTLEEGNRTTTKKIIFR